PPGGLAGPELQEDGEDLLPQGIGDLPDGPQRLGLRLPPGPALGLGHAGTLLSVTPTQDVTQAGSRPFRRFSDSFLGTLLALGVWREIWIANQSDEFREQLFLDAAKRASHVSKFGTDLSVWLDDVGCQFVREGQIDRAGQCFARALGIREHLVHGRPADSHL